MSTTTLAPPAPPTTLWPGRTRVEILVDPSGAALYDTTALTFVGFDSSWGPGAPLQRIAYGQRVEGTRPL